MIRGWWRETKSKRSAGQSTPSGINYIHLSCSRLGGQDQAEVQHQQTILEQSGDKTKRITQNYSWLSTKIPSSEWWFVRTGCFYGAYLQRLLAHRALDVFEWLVVIQEVISANHIHLQETQKHFRPLQQRFSHTEMTSPQVLWCLFFNDFTIRFWGIQFSPTQNSSWFWRDKSRVLHNFRNGFILIKLNNLLYPAPHQQFREAFNWPKH